MEKDYWLYQQHCHWQALNQNCMSFMLDSGRRDSFPADTNPYANMVPANGSLPGFAGSLPPSKAGQLNEPHGWFYCLPRHRQASTPIPNAVLIEFSASPFGYGEVTGYGGGAMPNAIQGSDQKRFLVFDQSGDQTNLFFSSAAASHAQYPNNGGSKPLRASGLHMVEPTTNRELIHQARPVIGTELKEENQESGDRSEMHEDTEELNALLYSDDEDDYDDDEETSTGHSPCDITGEKQEAEEGEEEVASSACPIKRKRQLEEDHYASSLVDTASSGEANESMEGDAESSCGEGSGTHGEIDLLLPANKRLRKERIRETVSILQSIIPGGKGKDAILVLDEAIQYVRTLKLKARSLK